MARVSIKPELLLGRPSGTLVEIQGMLADVPTPPLAPPTAGTSDPRPKIQSWKWPLLATLLVVVAALIVINGTDDPNYHAAAAAAVSGLSVFAAFYVAAQAIERMLEPLSKVLLPTDDQSADYGDKVAAADAAVIAWFNASDEEKPARQVDATTAMKAMADAKAALAFLNSDRVVLFWAIASIVGIIVSGVLHLYILKTAGVTASSRWLEVLATGLILGAGTKPLHDLITRISSSGDSDDGSSGGSTTDATGS